MSARQWAWRRAGPIGAALSLFGCATSVPLERGVLLYDHAAADTLSKQLLLNIARARLNLPIHFTAVSSIAATYKVSLSGGVGPALTGDKGFLVVPFLGGAVEENPTLSITPMQGEEFTQRLLTPLSQAKITALLAQGYDVDALLRLIASEIRLSRPDDPAALDVCPNRPSHRVGYETFRRVVSHLSWIQDQHALRVEPLSLRYAWSIPASALGPEAFRSLLPDFSVAEDAETHAYTVTRRLVGRLIIANYDPTSLPAEEIARLNEEAEAGPENEIVVDIRAGFPGGRFPIHGRLRLRSFHEVLSFIGRGLDEEPEYAVAPDPRTPAISENPVRTLDVIEVKSLPPDIDLSVSVKGHHYALRPEPGYQWNRKVFGLLYQLFQMTVSAPIAAGPAISIAK
jgi:hypothetical protein